MIMSVYWGERIMARKRTVLPASALAGRKVELAGAAFREYEPDQEPVALTEAMPPRGIIRTEAVAGTYGCLTLWETIAVARGMGRRPGYVRPVVATGPGLNKILLIPTDEQDPRRMSVQYPPRDWPVKMELADFLIQARLRPPTGHEMHCPAAMQTIEQYGLCLVLDLVGGTVRLLARYGQRPPGQAPH